MTKEEVKEGVVVTVWVCKGCECGPCKAAFDAGTMAPHQCPFFSKRHEVCRWRRVKA